jgi:hypothetical protein
MPANHDYFQMHDTLSLTNVKRPEIMQILRHSRHNIDAIITELFIVSPDLCIHGLFLSSSHFIHSHRVYSQTPTHLLDLELKHSLTFINFPRCMAR